MDVLRIFVAFWTIVITECVLNQYVLEMPPLGNETIYSETGVLVRSHMNAGLYGGLSFYSANQNCSTTFQVATGYQVSVTFPFFDMEPPTGDICNDKIILTEVGVPSTNEPYNQTTEFCTNQTYTSGTDKLNIQFITDGANQRKGFAMLLTSFHTGNCNLTEFLCDTDRCIHSSLKCDGHVQCLDGSDEDRTKASCPPDDVNTDGFLSLGRNVMLAIAGLAAVILFTIFISVIVYKNAHKDSCNCSDDKGDNSRILSPHVRSQTRTITKGYSNTLAQHSASGGKSDTDRNSKKKVTKVKVQPAPDSKW